MRTARRLIEPLLRLIYLSISVLYVRDEDWIGRKLPKLGLQVSHEILHGFHPFWKPEL
jgi:hypothetical protein